MVGSDSWAKNGACLPAGSEVDAEGRKAASTGRALWKPLGSQGYSDKVEVKTKGASVITGLELQKPRRGEAV